VVDEVIRILKKIVGKDDAVKIVKTMLSFPIKWIEVDRPVIMKMVDIFGRTTLDPRDAIHVSSMKDVGLSVILSEDADFDKVEGIERITASECVERYL